MNQAMELENKVARLSCLPLATPKAWTKEKLDTLYMLNYLAASIPKCPFNLLHASIYCRDKS